MAYLVDTCLISCTVRRVTPVASAVRLSTSVTDSPKQCCCTYRQTFIIIFLEWLGILALRRVMLCWDITDSEFPVNKRYLNPTLPYKMRFVKGLSSLPSSCEKYCFQKTSWLLRAHLSKIMCLLTMYSTWNHLHPSKKKNSRTTSYSFILGAATHCNINMANNCYLTTALSWQALLLLFFFFPFLMWVCDRPVTNERAQWEEAVTPRSSASLTISPSLFLPCCHWSSPSQNGRKKVPLWP